MHFKNKRTIIFVIVLLLSIVVGLRYYYSSYRRDIEQKVISSYKKDFVVLDLGFGNRNNEVGVETEWAELSRLQMKFPRGFTIDKNNNFYILDTWNNRIIKYDPNGQYIDKYIFDENMKWQKHYFDYRSPNGLIVADNNVYFIHKNQLYQLDLLQGTINTLFTDSNETKKIFSLGSGDEQSQFYVLGADKRDNLIIFTFNKHEYSKVDTNTKYSSKYIVAANNGYIYKMREKNITVYNRDGEIVNENICKNNSVIQSSDYFYFAKFGYIVDNIYFYLIKIDKNTNTNTYSHSILKTDLNCETLDEIEVSDLSLQGSNTYIDETNREIYISRLIINKSRDLLQRKPIGRWIIEKYEFPE